ncbi:endospore germination permease [Paenibacillus solisilvae]|uniref:Endospore germination permease n=1 Tax=Paenibacillus solisilvae TaxID=2486751 RepID=A0ABW0W6B1_9BACL
MNIGKISSSQLMILVAMNVIGSAILVIPTTLAATAKQDAWISAIVALAGGLAVVPIHVLLAGRLEGAGLVDSMERLLGKWLGKLIALLFVLTFPLVLAGRSTRIIGDFLTTQMMPETPREAIFILYMAVVIIAARAGIEAVARSAQIFFPLVVFLFLLMTCFLAPELRGENIQPILEDGVLPVVVSSYQTISFPFIESIVFLVLYSGVSRLKGMGSSLMWGIAIGGMFLFTSTLLCILVIGPKLTINNVFPAYVLAKKISVGRFVERIEVTIAVLWFLTIFFRSTVMFYISAVGLAQIFNMRDYKWLTIPLGMITVVFAIVSRPDITYLYKLAPAWGLYAPIHCILLPLALLGVAAIRGRRNKQQLDDKDNL